MTKKMPTPDNRERAHNQKADFTPRQMRVIAALLNAPHGITRENIDRVAKASNGPATVAALRAKLGDAAIWTELRDKDDFDGRPVKIGVYSLTEAGRRRLAELGITGKTCAQGAAQGGTR